MSATYSSLPTGARPPRHAYTTSFGESPTASFLGKPNVYEFKQRGTSASGSITRDVPVLYTQDDGEVHQRPPCCCGSWWRTRIAIIVACCIVVAGVVVVTTVLGLYYLVTVADHGPPEILGVGGQPPRKNGLFLYGGIRNWDLEEKTLSTRWLPYTCGEHPTDCTPITEDVSFFVNDNALGIGGFNASTSVLDLQAAQAGLKHDGWEQFIELDLATAPRSGELNLMGLETDSMYPFDWYQVQLLVAATNGDLSATLPVIGANVFNKVQAQWIATLNYTYLDNFNGSETKLTIRITLRRNMVIRISAFLLLIFNWIVTLAVLYMTLVYVQGRRELPDGLDSIALPFAVLFALPSVRSVMPGDPPFGCLFDFIGIVANLCIVAICATLLLLIRIHRETHNRRK